MLTVAAKKLDVVPLNLVRCVVSTIFVWALLPFFGGLSALAAIPPSNWLWLTVSVLALLVVGDTLYFRSLDLAGVSWAMPIASINPLWSVLLAASFVGEPLTWSLLGGAALVVLGTVLVSRSPGRVGEGAPAAADCSVDLPGSFELRSGGTHSKVDAGLEGRERGEQERAGGLRGPSTRRKGLLLALLVSIIWAVGAVSLKPATSGLHSVVANSVRQPMGMLILLGLTLVRGQWRELRGVDGKSLRIIIVASLLGTGLGSLILVMAVQLAGAGRTAVLSSTSPLLAIPFSMMWLRERPTRWTLAGTLLATAGIVMVI
jgi:uncharacterized membrane protein